MRIYSVLKDREDWLRANGLDSATEMDWKQRDEFLKWSMEKFFNEPGERDRDEANRNNGKATNQINLDRRSRFNREQQRRAGCSEIWELLSYRGRASDVYLRNAFQDPKECGSASERASTPTHSTARPPASKRRKQKPPRSWITKKKPRRSFADLEALSAQGRGGFAEVSAQRASPR